MVSCLCGHKCFGIPARCRDFFCRNFNKSLHYNFGSVIFEYRKQLTTKTMNEKLTFRFANERKVVAELNKKTVGWLSLTPAPDGMFRMGEVYICAAFRGKGLYREIISGAIKLHGAKGAYSDKRNELSNPIYERWVGQRLTQKTGDNFTQRVNISVSEDGSLSFTI